MNHEIEKIMQEAEGRYLSRTEAKVLTDWSATLADRLAAVAELERKERQIVEDTMNDCIKAFPDFLKRFPEGRKKGLRDMSLVLRYVGHAVVRNDPKYLDVALLDWLRTILAGVGLKEAFIRYSYESVLRHARQHMKREAFRWVEPELQRCIERLPRPAVSSADKSAA